ncbi:MAG: prolyl oligopeptidase family serine peptidase [Anaeromyxobacter sp.]
MAHAQSPSPAAPAAPAVAPEPPDPFGWLEEVAGERALDWARARNAESERALGGAARAPLEQRLRTILDSQERIPEVERLGDRLYNLWRDDRHPRGLWRRTTMAEYRKPSPAWEAVLDLDALGAAEQESWVWKGADCLRPEYRRCLISLSRGGSDAVEVREFDLTAKAFVKDGFALPEAKTTCAWVDQDTLFVETDLGPGSLTTSGYPRVVKRWRRGTPLAAAETVYEARSEDVWAFAYRDHTPGFERDLVTRGITFFSSETFLLRGGALVKLEKPDSASATLWREWLLLRLRDDWTVDGATYPAGALLAARLDAFLAGERRLEVLFRPSPRTSLAGLVPTRHHLLLDLLDNVRGRLERLTPSPQGWAREAVGGLPEVASVGLRAVDELESDDAWLTLDGFLAPTTLSLLAPGRAPEPLKQLPAFFDASGLAVAQHEAVSKDGTRVPYFEVAPAGRPLDGTTPTLLYGYGGFEVSLTPWYPVRAGAAWLERGGAFVVANLRGGGEFGPAWHQAALKEKRPRAYEDFIAVAEDLVRRGRTSPRRLGLMGGSNGGLLVGNALALRPDLFGGVVCDVPLLDMRRYSRLLAGASWMGEYGDPDRPDEWAFIQGFSPYHQVREGVRYPPTFFLTSTRDDRVHPGHARKMAARLLAMGQDVLYFENIEGGHGGAADNAQLARHDALVYTFLWQRLAGEELTPAPASGPPRPGPAPPSGSS